jgi:hypothetical protein
MELKYWMKRAIVVVGVLALVSIAAVAQEIRSEISVQGTGFFTKDTQGYGRRVANSAALPKQLCYGSISSAESWFSDRINSLRLKR